MADTVRYLLEEMVPELEALEARGYFSRSEIRAVVRRRQDYEYALKRMAAVKADYLRYIRYEEALEELRASRRASRGISGRKTLAEFCIVRRIHFIYERATRKFRGDLDLWSRWLRFCQRTGSGRQMSKVLTKALQLHPGCAALWAYAAAWELERNLNAGAARALMQRGLRMAGRDCPELWHEYFRMELLYALRLRERRRILGIADGDDQLPAGGSRSGGKGEAGTGESEGEGEGGGEAEESAAAVTAVLNGAVALVVYRSAIREVPHFVPFRARFLHILAPLHFPGRAMLEDAVYASVAADFGGSPEAWDLRARRHVLALGADAPPAARLAAAQDAVGVYEQGLAAVRTPVMAGLLLGFLQQQMSELEAAQDGSQGGDADTDAQLAQQRGQQHELADAAEWLRQRTQRAFEEAAADGLLSEASRLDCIAFFLHCGNPHAAVAAARAAVQVLPQSAALWQQLLVLEAAQAAESLAAGPSTAGQQPPPQQAAGEDGDSSEDEESDLLLQQRPAGKGLPAAVGATTAHSAGTAQQRLEETALRALRAVPAADAVPLWLTAIGVLCGGGCSLRGLAEQLVQAALQQAKGPVEGGLGAVAAALLSALHLAGGIDAARGLYRTLLPLAPPGGDFLRRLLQLEVEQQALAAAAGAARQQGSAGSALSDRQLQDLFEGAADAYGSDDVQMWLLYAEWQAVRSSAAGGGVAGVYWKARKALRQPEAFEAAFQLRFKLQPAAIKAA